MTIDEIKEFITKRLNNYTYLIDNCDERGLTDVELLDLGAREHELEEILRIVFEVEIMEKLDT